MFPVTPRVAVVALALLAGAAGAAVAAAPSDVQTPDAPTLELSPVSGDSVRIVARWRIPCDLRGCADSSRVTWTVGARVVSRSTPGAADSLTVAAPLWGDSVRVTVAVAAVRRGLVSPAARSTFVVRGSDAAPPVPDSLRVDTLGVWAALRDSFPVVAIRDTLGHTAGTVAVGDTLALCALARHRYTGQVLILVPGDPTPTEEAAVADRCERARQFYASERSG